MPILTENKDIKLMCSDHKVAKIYCQNKVVYSSGNICTYHVDSGITYQEEVDEGVSCLSPKTFTPSKSGWTFVGWRSDATTNPDCYTSYNMGDSPVTLYAVFSKTVTVTYYNGRTTADQQTKHRYYNNGNIADPSFALTQARPGNWIPRGWSTSMAADGGISYGDAAAFTVGTDITLYGMYYQTVTVTYYNGGTSPSAAVGTRYHNSGSGNVINPSFALTQATLSGWTARGWSTSMAANGGISYANGAAFTRDSNVTLYGSYQQTITLTYYNGSASAALTSGTRYYTPGFDIINPSFTLTPASLSGWTFRGWATSAAAAPGISYSSISGTAFEASATVYAVYYQTITVGYAGNGATSGSVAGQSGTRYYNPGSGAVANPTFTLQANGFAKTNYTFTKWALGSAGGTQYAAGASVTLAASTTFYAVWQGVAFAWISNYVAASGQTLTLTLQTSDGAKTLHKAEFQPEFYEDKNMYFYGNTNSVMSRGLRNMSVTFRFYRGSAGAEIEGCKFAVYAGGSVVYEKTSQDPDATISVPLPAADVPVYIYVKGHSWNWTPQPWFHIRSVSFS